jgi:hypothetical protein
MTEYVQVLEALESTRVEIALVRLMSQWEATHEEHERFRTWAMEVAGRLLEAAPDEATLRLRGAELKERYRALHVDVAQALIERGHIDEALVCRRSWVGHLLNALEPLGALGPQHKGHFVRSAA